MNLQKLFEAQRKLDEHIIREKGLEGQDLLPQKILALQVELGELANCWRGFKFWSNDREPRTRETINQNKFGKYGCSLEFRNPLLEEYVDCLHFTLSIGIELHVPDLYEIEIIHMESDTSKNITEHFIYTLDKARMDFPFVTAGDWFEFTRLFLGLGEMLGFTWEQIEEGYFRKNAINHERQERGY
ncbi:hypothetical protein DNHGIG_14840 [Collibacillus ludicampi]|uniref:dUTPase n=1 Tax=Collibacillus ludicampi TaxID=2771369 RepID=A0AAV4LDM4_9BACL|nr:dUTP diphosphatase [Collibacillus ludicampi]GIM45935.1 hypothetical protein DNHGIG_14840 [Collibacillus ludicampi]